MATIKAIEARSVHQIQSGQVIVDLCSVVKELVENSLDADATSVEVRFKNNGLDSIEVQDNGTGISPANYESVALKHYTSKLSSYEDLSTLKSFGFRGEALSSLCALSNFHVITAQADEAPKGKRLDFEISGKLKSTTVVASQKGTTACVEGLFDQLPVRRRELTKNIKREYGKVLGLLQAYACISTGVKFIVKNTMPKGKSTVIFATNSNPTTKENIANVYGARTLLALVPLHLELEFDSRVSRPTSEGSAGNKVFVCGHISRPAYGEGRQTPDRQMFFVNARPCGLPQIAKAINEVYKSFNASQSPFILADLKMDTNAYDVNVSPDKRTILLHDSATLIDKLKTSLAELFEKQDQIIPQGQMQTSRLPVFKSLSIRHETSANSLDDHTSDGTSEILPRRISESGSQNTSREDSEGESKPNRLLHDFFRDQASTREETSDVNAPLQTAKSERAKQRLAKAIGKQIDAKGEASESGDINDMKLASNFIPEVHHGQLKDVQKEQVHVRDFNERMAEQSKGGANEEVLPAELVEEAIPKPSPAPQPQSRDIVQNAFDRMRPKRSAADIATITIGDKTVMSTIGNKSPNRIQIVEKDAPSRRKRLKALERSPSTQQFSQSLRSFVAAGSKNASSSPDALGKTNDTLDEEEIEASQDDEVVSDSEADDEESLEDEEGRSQSHSIDLEQGNDKSDLSDSDEDYVDEAEKKAKEEARVAELIRVAEESAAIPSKENLKRASKVLGSRSSNDSTADLFTRIDVSTATLERQINWLRKQLLIQGGQPESENENALTAESEEERLSLTVSKDDFDKMQIVGQFNLGFILAVRGQLPGLEEDVGQHISDELFIIDQHASDEKYNFERLQANTVVGNQRLVRPLILDLTAVEEEIVIENESALEKNGFIVEVDTTGGLPVGQRCTLLSLPLSKEVVFDTRDLDELIHLLAECPVATSNSVVPRPSKVRKMFAMRACRSSVMIGKTLSTKQMTTLVRHMGVIEKPWNCPHGRPTMRHLMSLNTFGTWDEEDSSDRREANAMTEEEIWRTYSQ